MWSNIKVKTRPTDLPISLGDIKLRLDVVRDDQDAMIESFIKGAVARIDGPDGIGIAMLRQTWRLTLDCFTHSIVLPGWPIKSVGSVKYRDHAGEIQTVDAGLYRANLDVEPATITLKSNNLWPKTDDEPSSVFIEYELGESTAADVPADLIDAVSLLVGHRYENREATAVGVPVNKLPMSYNDIIKSYNRLAVTS